MEFITTATVFHLSFISPAHIQPRSFHLIGCHPVRPPSLAPRDGTHLKTWRTFSVVVSLRRREGMLMALLSGAHQDASQQNLL